MPLSQQDYASRPPPESAVARGLIERLLPVRSALLADVVPRSAQARNLDRVRVLDTNPPLFCAVERLAEGAAATVTIALTLDETFSDRPACSECSVACSHALGALDELLDWLFDEGHERRDEVLEAAEHPPWRRWLDALDDALGELEAETDRKAAARIWWNVDLEAQTIVPFIEHTGQRGGFLKPKRVRLEEVEVQARLGSADRAALASVRLHKLQKRSATREGKQDALFVRTLASLVGHPRVSVGTPGGTPWRVESAEVTFTVERSDEALDITVQAGDERLSPQDVRSQGPLGRTLLFTRPETRLLRIAHIEPQLAKLLQRWAKEAVPVPAQAQAELMHRLSRASRHVSVQAADLVGEATVPAQLALVAWLMPLPEGGLHIEIRVRPLADGPVFFAGLGPQEVLSSTPDRQILRATRDLHEERALARTTLSELELVPLPDDPNRVVITDLADALEAVQRLRDDPRIECQWPEQAWYPPISVGADRLRVSIQRHKDWFGMHGRVEIDGQRVELAVLLEAARRDRGYVQLDDHRFLKLEATLRSGLNALAPYLSKRQRGLQLSAAGAAQAEALGKDAYSLEVDEAWSGLLSRMKAAANLDPQPPDHLQSVLRPYQREGFVWLSRLAAWGAGAVLADDMGLGKTIQAIAVMANRADLGPQLVVAPTSVCFNWARELARFGPDLRVVNYAGSERTDRLGAAEAGAVFIASYGVVQRDAEQLAERSWATLVLDEAQAIKNPNAHRSRAVRSLKAEWTVALTGTPVENHPGELWSLFEAVFPGLLGTWKSFRLRFLATADKDGATFGTGKLAEVVRPYVLRRKKTQVARELPPRTEVIVDVTLSNRERALYDDARLTAVAELQKRDVTEQTHLHLQVFAALTRLRQLACHPRLVDPSSRVPSSKLERLMQIVHDLVAEDRRALVFSQFTAHLALARQALDARGVQYAYLDGSTPGAARAAEVDRFQQGNLPLFLISLKAGGTGLNLTAADTVIHLDPWWNPAAEDQATDRAHRLGQTQPVTVMRLVTRDTIEEKVLEVHDEKRKMVEDLLDGTEKTAKLSREELMALIRG